MYYTYAWVPLNYSTTKIPARNTISCTIDIIHEYQIGAQSPVVPDMMLPGLPRVRHHYKLIKKNMLFILLHLRRVLV